MLNKSLCCSWSAFSVWYWWSIDKGNVSPYNFLHAKDLRFSFWTASRGWGGSNWLLVDWLFRLMVTKLAADWDILLRWFPKLTPSLFPSLRQKKMMFQIQIESIISWSNMWLESEVKVVSVIFLIWVLVNISFYVWPHFWTLQSNSDNTSLGRYMNGSWSKNGATSCLAPIPSQLTMCHKVYAWLMHFSHLVSHILGSRDSVRIKHNLLKHLYGRHNLPMHRLSCFGVFLWQLHSVLGLRKCGCSHLTTSN